MKKHLSTILLVAIFLVGLSVLLYPWASNYFNQINASQAVARYTQQVQEFSKEKVEHLRQEARTYNKTLVQKPLALINGEPKDEKYMSLLNTKNNGMMGYVAIAKIGLELPLYHGTAESVLSIGVGHLEGSSLPVGGSNTHSIVTSHRGLPSAQLFTNLDKMKMGDTFDLYILQERLTYQVDQILVVLPEEVDELAIIEGQDYVTLVTCTPYAVNTHRLLVRGVRVETPMDVPAVAIPVIQEQKHTVNWIFAGVLVLLAIVAVLLLLILMLNYVKKRRRK